MSTQSNRRGWGIRLIGLAVAIGLLGAAGHQLYRYQKRRNTEALRRQAKAAHDRGDWATAAPAYRQYLQRRPADVDVVSVYARGALDNLQSAPQSVGEAIQAVRRWVRLAPDDTEAIEKLVHIYLGVREYGAAKDLAERWQRLEPESVDAVLSIAHAHHGLQQNDRTAAVLEEAATRMPGEPRLYPPLIEVLSVHLERVDDAKHWLERGLANAGDTFEVQHAAFALLLELGDEESAEESLLQAVDLAPEDPRGLTSAARFYLAHHDLIQAEEFIERAQAVSRDRVVVELKAEWAVKSDDRTAMVAAADELLSRFGADEPDVIARAAQMLIRAGAFGRADDCMARLSSMDNVDETASLWLPVLRGARALSNNQPHVAIRNLQTALMRSPDNVWATDLLAMAMTRIGAVEEAKDLYRRVAVLTPNGASAHLALAHLAWRDGQCAEVLDQLTAVGKSTGLSIGQRQLAMALRTSCRLNDPANRAAEPVALIMELTEARPSSPAVSEVVASTLVSLGKPDDARAYGESLLQDGDEGPSNATVVARALLAGGEAAAATTILDRVLAEEPGGLEAHQLYARACVLAGRSRELVSFIENAPLSELDRGRVWAAVGDAHRHMGNTQPALDAWAQAAKLTPDDLAVLVKLAQYATDDSAIRRHLRALRRAEGDDGVLWKFQTAAHALRDNTVGKSEAEAAALLRQCLSTRPGWTRARLLLGLAMERVGDLDAAADAYRTAIARRPQLAKDHVAIRLIEVLRKRGDFAEADAVLDQLARAWPDTPDVLRLQTERHLRQHSLESAVQSAEELLAVQDDNPAWASLTADLNRRAGHPGRAEEIARQALAEHPRDSSVLWSLARALVALQRVGEAEQVIRHAATQNGDPMHHVLLAQFLMQIEQPDRAEKAMENALEAGSDNALVCAAASDFWGVRGDRARQLAHARKSIQLRGENPETSLALARIYARTGSIEERSKAAAIVRRRLTDNNRDANALMLDAQLAAAEAPPDFARARQRLNKALTVDRRNAEAYRLLSRLCLRMGDVRQAEDEATAGLTLDPNDFDLLLLLGEIHCFRGQYGRATQPLRRAAALRPGSAAAAKLLIAALEQTGQVDQAFDLLERRHAATPDNASDTILLAKLYERSGDVDRAASLFDDATRAHESATALQENLYFLARQGRFDELYARASSYLAKAPADAETRAMAGELLGAHARDPEMQRTGLAWLNSIIEAQPAHAADAAYRAAICYYTRSDFVNAETMFLKCLRLDPHDPRAVNGLAWLYSEDLERPGDALRLIEKSTADGRTQTPEMLDTHAAALLRLGRHAEAIAMLRECLRRAGQTRTRTAATRRLALTLLETGDVDAGRTYSREAIDLNTRLGGLSTGEVQELRGLLVR